MKKKKQQFAVASNKAQKPNIDHSSSARHQCVCVCLKGGVYVYVW